MSTFHNSFDQTLTLTSFHRVNVDAYIIFCSAFCGEVEERMLDHKITKVAGKGDGFGCSNTCCNSLIFPPCLRNFINNWIRNPSLTVSRPLISNGSVVQEFFLSYKSFTLKLRNLEFWKRIWFLRFWCICMSCADY